MSTLSYARFWQCPDCRRRVPVRKDACMCGFDRSIWSVPVGKAAVRVPERQREERAAFAVLWLFGLGALLLGWKAFGLQTEAAGGHGQPLLPVAVSRVAPVTGGVEAVEGRDETTPIVSAQLSPPPVTAPPQTLPTEVPPPQVAPVSRLAGEDDYERFAREEDAAVRQRQAEWRSRAYSSIERLRAAVAGYRSQVCSEARGGIAVSTTRDYTGAYISARAEAQALEESARLAGVPPGWVRIPWGEFPKPEDTASSGYDPSAVAKRWSCGNVTP